MFCRADEHSSRTGTGAAWECFVSCSAKHRQLIQLKLLSHSLYPESRCAFVRGPASGVRGASRFDDFECAQFKYTELVIIDSRPSVSCQAWASASLFELHYQLLCIIKTAPRRHHEARLGTRSLVQSRRQLVARRAPVLWALWTWWEIQAPLPTVPLTETLARSAPGTWPLLWPTVRLVLRAQAARLRL